MIALRAMVAAACLLAAMTHAFSQGTAKSKPTLNAEVSNQFPDQSAGAITPQILRNVTNDVIASSQQYAGVNAQVSTSYTLQLSDYGQLVTFNNSSAVAVSLPGAGTAGFAPFNVYIANLNTGLVTITPTIGTINGVSSLTVSSGQSIWIVSDGTNYQVWKGFGSGTVNSGVGGQLTWYATTGSTVSGNPNANMLAGALTLGVANTTQGSVILDGSIGGALTITTQATAGTPTWTAGTSSGTPAVTASAPLAINTTTGNIACATCATSTLNTAALTAANDTNVTLTLGGSPTNALLNAASVTAGWTGQLAVGRGGTGQSSLTSNAFLTGNSTSGINQVAITGLVKGNGGSAPTAYAGTSCINQFPRSLDLNGAATCATVQNTDLANSSVTYGTTTVALGASSTSIAGLTSLGLTSGSTLNVNSDTFLGRLGAANWQLGAANAASPVGQTLSVQNATGTNTAAASALTIVGPLSTGTGTDGDIVFQTGVKTISGSTGATATTALILKGETQQANFAGNIQLVAGNSIIPSSDSTNAVNIANAANTSKIVRVDTTNNRVGINKTPGAFDLDTNGALNVGTTLTFGTLSATSLTSSTSTITALTANNSPSPSNDYFLYYSALDGAIRKCTVGACGSAASAGVSSLNGLTGGLSIVNNGGVAVSASGTSVNVAVAITPPQGRLTLASGTPVMTVSSTAQSTLFYDCLRGGNRVPFYNGTTDVLDTITACEVSSAMQSSSTGVLNANGVFDVFWEGNTNHNICVATNGSGGGWASDTGGSNTARGSGYSQIDTTTRPYPTNKNAVTHCYNGATDYGSVAANKLTYLATILTDASSAGLVSYTFGSASSGGGGGRFGVWNPMTVPQPTTVTDSGTSYTYGSGTVRQARASATNQIVFVIGLPSGGINFSYNASNVIGATSSAAQKIGVGFDVTNAFSIQESFQQATSAGGGFSFAPTNSGVWSPGVGLHTLAAVESSPIGTNTFNNETANALMAIINN